MTSSCPRNICADSAYVILARVAGGRGLMARSPSTADHGQEAPPRSRPVRTTNDTLTEEGGHEAASDSSLSDLRLDQCEFKKNSNSADAPGRDHVCHRHEPAAYSRQANDDNPLRRNALASALHSLGVAIDDDGSDCLRVSPACADAHARERSACATRTTAAGNCVKSSKRAAYESQDIDANRLPGAIKRQCRRKAAITNDRSLRPFLVRGTQGMQPANLWAITPLAAQESIAKITSHRQHGVRSPQDPLVLWLPVAGPTCPRLAKFIRSLGWTLAPLRRLRPADARRGDGAPRPARASDQKNDPHE